jgi:TolB-like protein
MRRIGRPLTLTALVLLAPASALAGPDPAVLAEFRADPMKFFFELRAPEAIECGQVILSEDGAASPERNRELTALSAIYASRGMLPEARAACLEMLSEDPLADLDSPELLPPPVVRLFYGVRDSLLLESGAFAAEDIRTVAVGDIENNSLVHGKYDLDKFARGLSQILITDLMDATPLKIVDRQRLSVLRQEIGMSSNADIVNPEYGVPLGKLCGAQSFLFGSLIQVEPKKIRFDLRWVNTSTSEILLSEGFEAKLGSADDLFKLEKKVLIDLLLPKMHDLLAMAGTGEVPKEKEMKKRLEEHLKLKKKRELAEGSSYVDLLLRTGDALLAEDRGDFASAETTWQQIHEIDPQNTRADDRARALGAYLELGGGQTP